MVEKAATPKIALGVRWRYENGTTFETRTYEVRGIENSLVTLANVGTEKLAYASIAWLTAEPNVFGSRWVYEGRTTEEEEG